MGLELSILGIRKIKDEEIKELTGKKKERNGKKQIFPKVFPESSI